MWLYISRVVRCARLAAEVGWPEPAAVVMSIANLIKAMAFACTEATQVIVGPFLQCGRSVVCDSPGSPVETALC